MTSEMIKSSSWSFARYYIQRWSCGVRVIPSEKKKGVTCGKEANMTAEERKALATDLDDMAANEMRKVPVDQKPMVLAYILGMNQANEWNAAKAGR